jgi:glutamate racemase
MRLCASFPNMTIFILQTQPMHPMEKNLASGLLHGAWPYVNILQTKVEIRAELSIPIIGVEPGIKPAAMQSQNGIVGVLATEATLKSDKFNALLATLPEHCRFIKQSGAGLVPLIEAGKANSEETLDLLGKHLEPILDAGSDTLVLGCTHYPFLRKSIRKLLGDTITLIDTSDAVVRQLGRQLETLGLNSDSGERGSVTFISSKNEASLIAMAKDLLSTNLNLHKTSTGLLDAML